MVRRMCAAVVATLLAAGLLGSGPARGEQGESAVRRVAAASLAVGVAHTCVVDTAGSVRCWGLGSEGRLGFGGVENVGDNEAAGKAGPVDVGEDVAALAAGGAHTCALLVTGRVRCWGYAADGQLGYGSTTNVGDNETPASAGDVAIFGTATAITAGSAHTCVLLTTGAVRCWGRGQEGQLGYGNTNNIGDNETPYTVGDVAIGGAATAITAGTSHTCALLSSGAVRCWGYGGQGRLGYGNTTTIGDNEAPAVAGDVPLGGRATAISAGGSHTCALLDTGAVRCWGAGFAGQLGRGSTADIGDDEAPAAVGDVAVGALATGITAGNNHTCAVLATDGVRCWGHGTLGRLGYGNTSTIGDDETPASASDVAVGERTAALSAGAVHTCALLTTGAVRCWGDGGGGWLGYGNTDDIGDDEVAGRPGDVPLGGGPTMRVTAETRTALTAAPARDRRAPYRYRLRGAVTPMGAVVDRATCTGEVLVVAKRGDRAVARRTLRLRADCRFAGSLRISARRWGGRATRLSLTASYRGSGNLAPSQAKARVVAGRR